MFHNTHTHTQNQRTDILPSLTHSKTSVYPLSHDEQEGNILPKNGDYDKFTCAKVTNERFGSSNQNIHFHEQRPRKTECGKPQYSQR